MLTYEKTSAIFSSSNKRKQEIKMKKNKSPKLTMTAIGFLIIGMGCLIVKNFLPEYVDAQGLLHEPYFFLIPIGFLIVFIALIIGSIAFINNMIKLKR